MSDSKSKLWGKWVKLAEKLRRESERIEVNNLPTKTVTCRRKA